MKPRNTLALLLAVAVGSAVLPLRSPAPLTFTPGEGLSYVPPGANEVPNAKNAQGQFDLALARENAGDIAGAVAGYRKTARRFPRSDVAPRAQFKMAQLLEKQGNLAQAWRAYEQFVKDYPRSGDFDKALEGEFRVGTSYLEGAKQKVLGVPTLPSMGLAINVFTSIVRNAPYSHYAPLAQFNIGMAKERDGDLKGAISAYQTVVDKYPSDPAAADAQYQIGFVWQKVGKKGSYDRIAAVHARERLEDFLAAYPNSEKAPQARENLGGLKGLQSNGALQIAQFYDKQKLYRAAAIYYNEVVRQNPNSPEGEQAKTRLAVLRTKIGAATVDGAINPTPVPVGRPANDTRLQAQTDTVHRPDYNGPPVTAPAPPPVPAGANPAAGEAGPGGGPRGSSSVPSAPLPLPPPIPESDQPTLPGNPDGSGAGSPLQLTPPGAGAPPSSLTPPGSAPAPAPGPANPDEGAGAPGAPAARPTPEPAPSADHP